MRIEIDFTGDLPDDWNAALLGIDIRDMAGRYVALMTMVGEMPDWLKNVASGSTVSKGTTLAIIEAKELARLRANDQFVQDLRVLADATVEVPLPTADEWATLGLRH